jgi:hypothetical protein
MIVLAERIGQAGIAEAPLVEALDEETALVGKAL